MIIFNWRGHRYQADDRFRETGKVVINGISLEVEGGWSDDQRPIALQAITITDQNRDKFVTATRVQ